MFDLIKKMANKDGKSFSPDVILTDFEKAYDKGILLIKQIICSN